MKIDEILDVHADEEISTDDLRNQLQVLQNEAETELVKSNTNNSVVSSALRSVYDGINERYGIDLKYEDFTQFINNIADKDKISLAVEELVGKQVVSTIIIRSQIDMIASIGMLLQKIMYLSVKEMQQADALTPELVGLTEKLIDWFNMFSEIKKQFQVSDLDKSIKNITGGINNSDIDSEANSELINMILNSMRK